MYFLEINRKAEPRKCAYIKRFIFEDWLTLLWSLASPKSAWWAGKLKIRGGVSVEVQG